MGKIGILGGTFNPIHIGHLILAQYAYEFASLDEIWLMPTGFSYLKKDDPVPDGKIRLAMLEKVVEDISHFKTSDIEIKRTGYTYTYETLEYLHKEYPQHEFFFIIGADCLFSMEKWKNIQSLFDQCTVIAAIRGNVSDSEMTLKKEELCDRFHAKILLMPFKQIDLSSTEIRARIRDGKSASFMVPDPVLKYIQDNHLYHND